MSNSYFSNVVDGDGPKSSPPDPVIKSDYNEWREKQLAKMQEMKDEMDESFKAAERKEFRRRIATEVLPTILQINSTVKTPADVSDCVKMAWDIADLMMEAE